MNWQTQMEQMISSWTDTQRRMWDQWMEAVRGVAPGAEQVQAQYHQQLDAWEKAVREALERQQEWVQNLQGGMMDEQAGRKAAEQWMQQVQENMSRWTEAQSELWNSLLKSMGESGGNMPWARGTEDVVKAWQDAASKAQATMEEWSKSMGASGGSSGQGGGRSRSGGKK
ncbi:MAG TPA: hypothetical protein VKA32_02810 [Gammaproteobacteria bacterium]|nr:hypothetical protein [Gammaproteobacteria bacterium]